MLMLTRGRRIRIAACLAVAAVLAALSVACVAGAGDGATPVAAPTVAPAASVVELPSAASPAPATSPSPAGTSTIPIPASSALSPKEETRAVPTAAAVARLERSAPLEARVTVGPEAIATLAPTVASRPEAAPSPTATPIPTAVPTAPSATATPTATKPVPPAPAEVSPTAAPSAPTRAPAVVAAAPPPTATAAPRLEPSSRGGTRESAPQSDQQYTLALHNEARAANGAPPLVLDTKVSLSAQRKAEDMASRKYFAHVGPDGRKAWDWLRAAGASFTTAGENLGTQTGGIPPTAPAIKRLFDVMMAETPPNDGHRVNILNRAFRKLGVGVAVAGDKLYWVCHYTD